MLYCFAEIEGFSSFGKYVGNGNTSGDGPFSYTGFRPQLVAIKGIDGSRQWIVYDYSLDTNPNKRELYWSSAVVAGSAYDGINFLSNGFKVVNTVAYNDLNLSGESYVFMAWATNPFGGESTTPATAV